VRRAIPAPQGQAERKAILVSANLDRQQQSLRFRKTEERRCLSKVDGSRRLLIGRRLRFSAVGIEIALPQFLGTRPRTRRFLASLSPSREQDRGTNGLISAPGTRTPGRAHQTSAFADSALMATNGRPNSLSFLRYGSVMLRDRFRARDWVTFGFLLDSPPQSEDA